MKWTPSYSSWTTRCPHGPGDRYIVDLLDNVTTPKILVINKIDKLQTDDFAEIYNEYDQTGIFEKILGVSAKEGTNVGDVIAAAADFMEDGPYVFPGRHDNRKSGALHRERDHKGEDTAVSAG